MQSGPGRKVNQSYINLISIYIYISTSYQYYINARSPSGAPLQCRRLNPHRRPQRTPPAVEISRGDQSRVAEAPNRRGTQSGRVAGRPRRGASRFGGQATRVCVCGVVRTGRAFAREGATRKRRGRTAGRRPGLVFTRRSRALRGHAAQPRSAPAWQALCGLGSRRWAR